MIFQTYSTNIPSTTLVKAYRDIVHSKVTIFCICDNLNNTLKWNVLIIIIILIICKFSRYVIKNQGKFRGHGHKDRFVTF